MKSKTSFFNWMLLRKNVTRFSPIWIAYLIVGILVFPINFAIMLSEEGMYRPDVTDIERYIGGFLEDMGPAVACGFGLVIAMAVFSYLYHARSASMMHSLPIRRSTLFVTNYTSGLLFILVPNAIVALLTGAVTLLGGVFCPGMIMGVFLMLSGMEIFFFSMATFVAMFTGHLVALPLFYAICNGLVAGLYMCIMFFVEPYLFGIASFELNILSNLVEYLTPLGHFYETVEFNYIYNDLGERISTELCGGVSVAVYTVAGFVLALLAYAAYRNRRSESAGDVVSVGWAKVLFRYGVGICAAFSVGQGVYYAIFDGALGTVGKLLCMILVGAVGFYVAQILLHKSFHVLKKSFVGSGICAAVVLAIFAGAYFDVTGFTRYVPDVDKVDSAFVRVGSYGYGEGKVEGKTSLETAVAIHQYIVDHRWELENKDWPYHTDIAQSANYGITYYMENGSTVYRSYQIPLLQEDRGDETTLTGMVEKLVAQDEFRAASFLRELYTDREEYAILSGAFSYYTQWEKDYYHQTYAYGAKEATLLYDAILEDIMQGRTHEIWLLKADMEQDQERYMNEVFFTCRNLKEGYEQNFYIELSSGMTSTLKAMETLGITGEHAPLITSEEYHNNVEQWEKERSIGISDHLAYNYELYDYE